MIVKILHLSDIHIQEGRNIILNRREKLFDSIKNHLKGSNAVIVVTSGDIVLSGKLAEYRIAGNQLYKYLFDAIKAYTGLLASFVFVPGNHDLLFDEKEEKIRKLILKDFSQNGFDEISEHLVDICCKPQKNYFEFINKLKVKYNGDIVFDDPLLRIVTFKFGQKIIKFNCFNSSWHSTLKEQYGSLGFPVEFLVERIPSINNDLSISIVHHPFNWQNQQTSKNFREFLAKSSDVIITGHEHEKKETLFSDLENQYPCIHIESPALQDSKNERISSFNLITLDLPNNSLQIKNFEYDNSLGHYSLKSDSPAKSLEKSKKIKSRLFQIKKSFLNDLENPGASFTHSTADEIKLNDIYVPCVLNNISVSTTKKIKLQNFVLSSIALELKDTQYYKVIFGNDSSGKTSLLKHHFLKLYTQGYYPIFINGENIDEVNIDKLKSLIGRQFKKQYEEAEFTFDKLDFNKTVILIDDFHKFKHKPSKPVFINNLKKLFKSIVITGNELMQFESYTDKSNNKNIDIFDSFDRYTIQEFGPTMRFDLINKWYRLGKDYISNGERNDFLRTIDQAEENISTIIGKNLIPAYPIYMLSILQALEGDYHDNNSNNLHGYYYEMLITRALKRVLYDKDEIGFYITVAKEYFFFLFNEKIRFQPVSKQSFNTFLESHASKYRLDQINFTDVLNILLKSKILKEIDNDYVGVTYKYIYYYFVAKYLSDNLDIQENKDIVDRMTDRVYREEYSNIILFLSHLSGNKFLIDKLIEKSKKIFEDQKIIKLESDVDFINVLQKNLPEQIIENLSVDDARLEDRKEQEEFEEMEKNFEENKEDYSDYDLNEDINTIDILSKLTKAIRTINILGHITRKSWGELVGSYKMVLAEETYLLGLRTLQFNFSLLEDSQDALIEHIKSIIHKRFINKSLTKTEIENVASSFIFNLSSAASFGLVKRVANAIGSQKLSKTFEDIQSKHPINSVKLINTAIKLDHYSGFPYNDLEALKKTNEKNPLGFAVLQNLVTDHLYLFEVPFDRKQQVCELLNIKIADQRFINQSSPIKKG